MSILSGQDVEILFNIRIFYEKGKRGDCYGIFVWEFFFSFCYVALLYIAACSIKETTQLSAMESRTKWQKLSVSPMLRLSLGNLHSSIVSFACTSPTDLTSKLSLVLLRFSPRDTEISVGSRWIGIGDPTKAKFLLVSIIIEFFQDFVARW